MPQVVVMEGDLALEGLGLSPEDQAVLASDVHIVIHAASIIDLEADVQRTLRGNYLGTRRVLDLAARGARLRAVVALSSAAANVNAPPGSSVDEAIYPLFFGSQEVRGRGGVGVGVWLGLGWARGSSAVPCCQPELRPPSPPAARQVDHASLVEDLLGLAPESANVRAQMYLDMWGFPNTYTLGKNLTEKLVAQYHA
jgi:hypothetical protein